MVLVTSRYRENLVKTDGTYKNTSLKGLGRAESGARKKVGW